MGRIVAIPGGDLKTTHKINQYIVALTKKENPNFLFIGTASCDAAISTMNSNRLDAV